LVELADAARFIIGKRPLEIEQRTAAVLTPEARVLLHEISPELDGVENWSVSATEEVVRAFAQRKGIKLGNIAQPLRAALTGRTTSPPIFEVLAVLGKRESLARIRDQVVPAVAQQ